MSVLINMEMPEKRTILTIFPNGYVAIYDAKDSFIGETKAFPVPKHGRLIDADDAIETAWMILRGLGYLREENAQLEQTVREVFATAPAIEVEEHG